MADKRISFKAPMIRALLDGRKTQTRRVLKPQPFPAGYHQGDVSLERVYEDAARFSATARLGGQPAILEDIVPLRFAHGDRLWVREGLRFNWQSNDWLYAADESIMVDVCGSELETPSPNRWPRGVAPSIHMPKWASRLTLIVTDVRVQRLQEITRGDATEEGCPFPNMADGPDPRDWFRDLWNSIYGPGAWDANPWVAAYTFRVVKANIDSAADAP
jgi:hypothetical protein